MENPASELSADTFDGLAQVPLDDALDMLGDLQRRKLLFALLDRNQRDGSSAMHVDTAVEAETVDQLRPTSEDHLPKLEEYGFIVWDRETDEVSTGSRFGDLRPLLQLLADREDELPPDWL